MRSSYIEPDVHREVAYEGYRADLVIVWTDASYTHVEVKVGDPSLAKTLETALKMAQRYGRELQRRSDIVLLLPSQQDPGRQSAAAKLGMRERVHCLTWLDVARALRKAYPWRPANRCAGALGTRVLRRC